MNGRGLRRAIRERENRATKHSPGHPSSHLDPDQEVGNRCNQTLVARIWDLRNPEAEERGNQPGLQSEAPEEEGEVEMQEEGNRMTRRMRWRRERVGRVRMRKRRR